MTDICPHCGANMKGMQTDHYCEECKERVVQPLDSTKDEKINELEQELKKTNKVLTEMNDIFELTRNDLHDSMDRIREYEQENHQLQESNTSLGIQNDKYFLRIGELVKGENKTLKDKIEELERRLTEQACQRDDEHRQWEQDIVKRDRAIKELEGQVKYLDDLDDTHIALILELKKEIENNPWKKMYYEAIDYTEAEDRDEIEKKIKAKYPPSESEEEGIFVKELNKVSLGLAGFPICPLCNNDFVIPESNPDIIICHKCGGSIEQNNKGVWVDADPLAEDKEPDILDDYSTVEECKLVNGGSDACPECGHYRECFPKEVHGIEKVLCIRYKDWSIEEITGSPTQFLQDKLLKSQGNKGESPKHTQCPTMGCRTERGHEGDCNVVKGIEEMSDDEVWDEFEDVKKMSEMQRSIHDERDRILKTMQPDDSLNSFDIRCPDCNLVLERDHNSVQCHNCKRLWPISYFQEVKKDSIRE